MALDSKGLGMVWVLVQVHAYQCKDHFKLANSSKVRPTSIATRVTTVPRSRVHFSASSRLFGPDLKTCCCIQMQARVLDVALTRDASETKAGRPGGQDGQIAGYVRV